METLSDVFCLGYEGHTVRFREFKACREHVCEFTPQLIPPLVNSLVVTTLRTQIGGCTCMADHFGKCKNNRARCGQAFTHAFSCHKKTLVLFKVAGCVVLLCLVLLLNSWVLFFFWKESLQIPLSGLLRDNYLCVLPSQRKISRIYWQLSWFSLLLAILFSVLCSARGRHPFGRSEDVIAKFSLVVAHDFATFFFTNLPIWCYILASDVDVVGHFLTLQCNFFQKKN